MGVTEDEVVEGLKQYFLEHGFGQVKVDLNHKPIVGWLKQKLLHSKSGKITSFVENNESGQTIDVILKRNRLSPNWTVDLDGQYLDDYCLEFLEDTVEKDGKEERKVVYQAKTHTGFFGGRSPNLKRVYKLLPSLKWMIISEFLSGAQSALIETSTNAKLFINLKDLGVISVMTDLSLAVPGIWAGERKGSWIVNNIIAQHNPASKIKKLYDECCSFITKKPWHARIDLEEYLKKNYFKDDEEFEERYLTKVNSINDFMRKEKPNKVKEVANMIFDNRPPSPAKDKTLYDLIRNQALIRVEDFEPGTRKFFDEIAEQGLWNDTKQIQYYRDCFRSVVKHGWYEEISDEQRMLKDGKKVLMQLREERLKGGSRKLRKDDWLDLENIVKGYQAFLLTEHPQLKEKSEAEKEARVQGKLFDMPDLPLDTGLDMTQALLKEMSKPEPKISAISLDAINEMLTYANIRMSAVKEADVREVRVYCSLNDARKKFLDEPMMVHKREPTAEEMKIINDYCFGNINKARVGELASTVALAGMVGISHFIDTIPGGWVANAVGWGLPIGLKALYESYCHARSERLMEYYLLVKYRKALEKESVDPEAAFSELGSLLRRIYLSGYMLGTAIGMPALYATTPERHWPIYASMSASAVLLGASYTSWRIFELMAKSEGDMSAKPAASFPRRFWRWLTKYQTW